MGLGIAYVAATRAKLPVLLYDKSKDQVTRSLSLADKLLSKDVKKGKLQESEAEEARERITVVDDVKAFRDADMCIEAVSESFQLKRSLFSTLADVMRPDAILASNTSSISITKIASTAMGPDVSPTSEEGLRSSARVIGVHFFNPVPVMPLVELITGLQTSPDVLERSRQFAIACAKEVTMSKDVPGFVSNALLMPFLNEAIIALEKGVATKQDIDKTLRLGMGHPMGPLTLADFIGLDTCLAIQRTLLEGTGDSKYRPAVLLERMVDAGWLGKKTRKGFYTYDAEGKVIE